VAEDGVAHEEKEEESAEVGEAEDVGSFSAGGGAEFLGEDWTEGGEAAEVGEEGTHGVEVKVLSCVGQR
jgi:hypothetical protein